MARHSQAPRNQHVFARSAIRRFCGPQNKVRVWRKNPQAAGNQWVEFRLCGADERVFAADYVWDQATELWTGGIDRRYSLVAGKFDRQIGPKPEVLGTADSAAVTEFYYLWQSRAVLRHTPEPHKEIELVGVERDRGLTPEVLKRCAELGVVTANLKGETGFGAIAGRPVHGLQVRRGLQHFRLRWGVIAWACYEFSGGSLIVPDEFPLFPCIPLSPSRCFAAIGNSPLPGIPGPSPYPGFAAIQSGASDTGRNLKIDADSLNALAKENARHYYFQTP